MDEAKTDKVEPERVKAKRLKEEGVTGNRGVTWREGERWVYLQDEVRLYDSVSNHCH